MKKWAPIDSAPKDGTIVYLKRLFGGEIVASGKGYWGRVGEPIAGRQAWLDIPTSTDNEQPGKLVAAIGWLTEDGRQSFPAAPSHWRDA